ncbi:hypothetical protein DB30_01644 [Enhygromyxa salina]|uniref:Uncharacterized protein n=1 Tax=Enhygromyxa salina TaxID=215803 RepID=A0A0C2D958_9BACT|nr:hypothetical protein [Enhygromyxa salina]KIG18140.1 hypothetical protein DB30_01644 [Enhygromyxa salina]
MSANRKPSAEHDVVVARPRSKSRRRVRQLGPIRPRPGTLVALTLAGLAIALAWADPFAKPDDGALLVNNRLGGRRVFPTLVDADPSKATIELQAADGPVVRVVPTPNGGHQLMHGDEVLGPVADEDFEGLWSSLRLATARRSTGKVKGVGQGGVIRISLPGENLKLELGSAATGGGVYGSFEVNGDTWVVETEMLTLVEQPPKSWLSKRLLPVDVERVTGLAWGDELILGRSDDGFWRVREGGTPALLATEAVEFRIRRLLRAQLDPFVERDAVASESLRPWLVVTTLDGSSRALHLGGACPGDPSKRLVDRGPGLLGCVPAELLERWPLLSPVAGMLEPRLVPHDYGRIVGIDLDEPAARKLMRRGGEWFYTGEGETGVEAIPEEEVRRWYQALGRLEVALLAVESGEPELGPDDEPPPAFEWSPDWVLVVHADTGEDLRVTCDLSGGGAPLCVRDDGPMLRLLGELPINMVFDAETFAARRLTEINPGEIRELEILPPPDVESLTVRQSVHADMGAWQLDAPPHVDDSGAIDDVRLENVLWALRQLRAEAWVEAPAMPPLRRIVAEIVPERGLRRTVTVTVFPDCVVEVEGHRPAFVNKASCAALNEDLFFDDPLRFWLERSRGVEVSEVGKEQRVFLRRRDQEFVTSDDQPLHDEALEQRLRGWIDWRSDGIRAGQPDGEAAWMLDVRRDFGPPAQVEIGDGWARLRGADWYYVERPAGAAVNEFAPGEASRDDFDPGAIELD